QATRREGSARGAEGRCRRTGCVCGEGRAAAVTRMRPIAARERLVVGLDVASKKEALNLVRRLTGEVGMFKVGKRLFVHAGPDIVRAIRKRGGEVFLDLKFHDIPETVANASVEAARLGVWM